MNTRKILLFILISTLLSCVSCDNNLISPYDEPLSTVSPIPTVSLAQEPTQTEPFEEKVDRLLDAQAKEYGGEIIRDESAVITNIPVAGEECNLKAIVGGDMSQFTSATTVTSSSIRLRKYFFDQWNLPGAITRMRANRSGYAMFDYDEYRVFMFLDDYFLSMGLPVICGNVLVMKKVYKYSDFSEIKVGDRISDVEKIDDTCAFYRHMYDENSKVVAKKFIEEGSYGNLLSSVHYLEEGLLRIVYGGWDENDECVITDIKLYSDYLVDTLIGRKINYLINPLDIPK